MNLRRVGILLSRELIRGPKNFIFTFALVMPIALTLVISLAFGTWFSGKATLGIVDNGASQLVTKMTDIDALVVKKYDDAADLRSDVARGTVDMGLVLPANFDAEVQQGHNVSFDAYVWGQSLLKDRALLGVSLAQTLRNLSGQEPPVEAQLETLGDDPGIPWNERLLPFVVMMTIMIGGTMLPATSLVEEKQKRTLQALLATPTSLGEVFLAKGLMGMLLSLVMGVVVLVMNQAFGVRPLLLIFVLALGAVMASAIGVLLGAFIKDINTLFATIKGMGIFLYAPALIYLFPELPEWVAKIFPTYYMIGPVITITQKGGGWNDIAVDMGILVLLIAALIVVVGYAGRRLNQREL